MVSRAGVIGWPVAHSLSPKMHNHWFEALGIEGQYVAEEVAPDRLAEFLHKLPERGWRGCNVTIPHKEAVLRFLEQHGSIDEVAQEIGAVNTVIVDGNGKLFGTNTDAYGFLENIRSYLSGRKKAVVVGAGGAASAVWQALLAEGFEEIIVTNRTQAKFSKLKGNRFHIEAWKDRSAILAGADLLVNTTSLGMVGKDPLEIDLAKLPSHALVTDIVYNPLETPLLQAAKARGNPIVDGLGMLIYQGAKAFEIWFGIKPPVNEELRKILVPNA